jgi:hypothetical protein
MRKLLLPVNAFCLFFFVIGPVGAQQQRLACPQISPNLRQKAISRMMGFAREGRINGCRRNPDAPPDVECGLVLQFKIEVSNFSFNIPWSGLVGCFPELGPIPSINAQAIARNEELKKQDEKKAEWQRQDQQARDNEPKHLLTRTYYDYMIIKKCFDQRQG